MSLQGLYTKVISTRREKLVDDGYGGSKRSWQDHLTGIRCRIVQSSGRWELTISGKTVSRTHLMFCDPDVDITTADKVIDNGEEYQVIFVKQCENSRDVHHLEVSLEKI